MKYLCTDVSVVQGIVLFNLVAESIAIRFKIPLSLTYQLFVGNFRTNIIIISQNEKIMNESTLFTVIFG